MSDAAISIEAPLKTTWFESSLDCLADVFRANLRAIHTAKR